jgi:hypothetical protein
MSLEGVPPYEMSGHDHDDELEQLPELEAFSEGLRAAFPTQALPAEDEHVASMVAAAHLLSDKGDPVATPVSNADAPAAQVSWLPKQRRNRMQEERNRSKRRVVKVLAPATVFFALLSGVAWAGGLPAPLQQTASHVAGFAGLTLDDGTEGDATEVETPDPTDTDVPDTTTDDQDGDHQGEDTQDATSTDDNQGDDNNQGEDTQDATSGDNTGEDNQGDDNSQGEDTQDSTSGDNSGEDNQDSTSGDNSGEDNQDSTSGDDNQGDSSGDSGSGDSGGDNQD